jgi:hypothetical protein
MRENGICALSSLRVSAWTGIEIWNIHNNNKFLFTRPRSLGGVAVEPTTGGGLARQQHTSPETQEPRESNGMGEGEITKKSPLDPEMTSCSVLFSSGPALSRVSRLFHDSPALSPSPRRPRERAGRRA